MAVIEQVTRLALYETKAVVPVQDFAPGVYTYPLHTMGNSLLSTLWVKTAGGATVTIKYWDFGPGGAEFPGERVDLKTHATISTDDTTDRIIVTSLHDKPRIEITVTGGTATFGVYVTVVATFASDLDANLKFDQEDANLSQDRGLVISGYNPEDNKFYFLRVNKNGSISYNESIPETEGSIYTLDINNAAWTLVPVIPNRRAVAIINTSDQEIKLNYTQPLDYVGIPVDSGNERRYEHRIPFYLRSKDGPCTVLVEHIV